MRFVSGPRMPPSTFGKLIVAGVAAPGSPTGKVTRVLGFALVRPTAVSAALAAPAVSALSTPATVSQAAARVALLRFIVTSFRQAPGRRSGVLYRCGLRAGRRFGSLREPEHLGSHLSMRYDAVRADRRSSTARPCVPRARRREPPRDGRPPVARCGVRERARRTVGHVA